jgi:hypothetical protein
MIFFNDFQKARLGNQLFFVAGTIGIALKNNTTYSFGSQMGHGGVDYSVIFENQLPISNQTFNDVYHQNGFNYTDISLTKDTEIQGYFQSEKFFKHCESEIKKQFKFKESVVDEVIKKYPTIKNSSSIHIRRGDYLNQLDYHPTINLNYYQKFISDYTLDCEHVYVFSDDVEWCKNVFIGDKFIFPNFNDKNDLYSFVLLSQSKKIAISNSTYSWWASWLNQNKNKQIYCFPHNKWFGKMYSNLNTEDVLPIEWNVIEYDES